MMEHEESVSPIPPPEDIDVDEALSDASGDNAKVPS